MEEQLTDIGESAARNRSHCNIITMDRTRNMVSKSGMNLIISKYTSWFM